MTDMTLTDEEVAALLAEADQCVERLRREPGPMFVVPQEPGTASTVAQLLARIAYLEAALEKATKPAHYLPCLPALAATACAAKWAS